MSCWRCVDDNNDDDDINDNSGDGDYSYHNIYDDYYDADYSYKYNSDLTPYNCNEINNNNYANDSTANTDTD